LHLLHLPTFLSMPPLPPIPTLFPYTTLFRSTYTLSDAILQLKEQYDAENILRSRDEIQDVARLLKLAAVFDPRPQSWELDPLTLDRKSTRLNSSHVKISYAVFCLKKKIIWHY